MPRFQEILSEEQRWYLTAYLKTLPKDHEETVNSLDDLNVVEPVHLPTLSRQQWEPHHGKE